MNLIHIGLPHSLAGNNLCHLLQLCLHLNQKRVLYFKLSHVSSNLARWGSLVFTWALMWPASFPETASALITKGFFHLKSTSFHQREAQTERQNSSLEGQQRELKAGEHSSVSIFLGKVGCSAWVGFCKSLGTLAVCSMNEHFFTSVHWQLLGAFHTHLL